MATAGSFVSTSIGVAVVAVVVVGVVLPIMAGLTIPEGMANASIITTIVNILPVLILVGVMLLVVGVMYKNKN